MLRKLSVFVVASAILAGLAGSAQAMTTGTLTVAWNATSGMGFTYLWSDNNDAVFNTSGRATNGWATGTYDAVGPTPVRDLGNIWCVDLFNFSANSYPTEQWTDADGAGSDIAWTSPVGDGDDLRRAEGLYEASYLAYKYGNTVATDTQKRTLQMAMWTAAYGVDRFKYLSASGGGISEALLATYVADIPNGTSFTRNEWYDNNDTQSTGPEYYQDFMNDVPEPSSLLLLGGVMFGAAALGWRKRRSA